MSYDYSGFVTQLANLMVQISTDTNFQAWLPTGIDYAEQRCYRELDLQATRTLDYSTALTSGDRTWDLTVPASLGTPVVVEQLNVWTPVGASSATAVRNPLTFVTKEFIDFAYPTNLSSRTGLPQYVAPISNALYIFGPSPDQSYTLEFVGTVRPAPLSATPGSTTTFLTQNLPDLFMAAAMIAGSAYMRDFGALSDDPKMGATWESQYKILFDSANKEELRKRFQSQGWQSMTPNAIATPPRA